MPIIAVEARVFVHATEEKEKVLKALMEIIPEDLRNEVKVEEEHLEGHYGNPIIKLTVRVEGEKAREVVEYIVSRLSSIDKSILYTSLEDRVDKDGTLYFRLSKQEAYRGNINVYESDDVIRISVHFAGRRSKAMKEYERLLGGGSR